MGRNCLICNCSVKRPPGPASTKPTEKVPTRGLSGFQCVTLCKALNIPEDGFKANLHKFPVCKECTKKVQNMTHIVTALENLQDTVRQFRSEIRELLEEAYEAEMKPQIPVVPTKSEDGEDRRGPVLVLVGDQGLSVGDGQNTFRKQILDILQRRFLRATGKEKISKGATEVPDIKGVKKKMPESSNTLGSPAKKSKLEPKIESCLNKRLEIRLERVDFKGPIPIITGIQSMQKSVKFLEVENEDWQSTSPMDNAEDGFLEEEFNELEAVISPDNEDSQGISIADNVDEDTRLGFSDTDGNKSGGETSAYFDSSNSEDDDDLAPSKQKKHGYRKKKVIGNNFCNHCQRNFKTDFVLKIHIKRRHEGNKTPFECTEEGCDKVFRQKYLWENHLEEHQTGQKLKKYVCDCGKKFITSNSLHRHASSHTGKWKFPCTIPLCDKGFHRPSELEIHLKKHDDPKHNCEFCEKKFDKKSELVNHMTEYHPDENFKDKRVCEICCKIFSGADSLRCHQIQIHNIGECKHKCDVCNKGFVKISWLHRHKASHSMEKTLSCDKCPETFRFSASLRAHRMKHEGKYPYSCEICDKKFILKQSLTQHQSTHATDKPFICEYCGKTYSNKFYISLHVKRVHWEEMGLEERPKYLRVKPKSNCPSPKKPLETKSIKKKRKKKILDGSDCETEMVLDNLDLQDSDEMDDELIQRINEEDAEEATQIIEDEIETQRIETDPFIEFVVTHTDK